MIARSLVDKLLVLKFLGLYFIVLAVYLCGCRLINLLKIGIQYKKQKNINNFWNSSV